MIVRLLGVLGVLLALTTTVTAGDVWETTVDLDGRHMRSQETNLGNFAADAVRLATKADIAVVQSSAFVENVLIKAGELNEQLVREKLTSPTSSLFVLKMQPAVLKKVMERAVSEFSAKTFLQVSGMIVTVDSSQDTGNRVVSISVNGKMLDLSDTKTTLTVGMPQELGKGAFGYIRVYPNEVIATAREMPDQTLISAMRAEFVRCKGKISPIIEGRLKDVSAKKGN